MEGQEESQQPHLALAHKLFLFNHPDVEDTEKVRLKDEVFASVKADDMAPLYESLAGSLVLEMDEAVLESIRKRIEEELKKLNEKMPGEMMWILAFSREGSPCCECCLHMWVDELQLYRVESAVQKV